MKKALFALIFFAQMATAQVTTADIKSGNIVLIQTRSKQGTAQMIRTDTLLKAAANNSFTPIYEWREVRYSAGLLTGSNSKYFELTNIDVPTADIIILNSQTYSRDGLMMRGLSVATVQSFMWSGLGTNHDYFFETSTRRLHFPSLVLSNYLGTGVFILRFQTKH